jgi:3-oxoacyl-[acyl-carrier protein] reductase
MSENRVAIVTGSSRGLGRAIALAIAGAGCRVVVNYRQSLEAALAVKREAEERVSGSCLVVKADVTREAEVAAMIDEALRNFGRLDILVNNAGISDPRGFLDMDLADWSRMMEVNLTSAFLCCRAVLPHMLKRGWGRIINVSSTSGLTGGTSGAHYAAAKGGMIAMTRALASEFAPRGITVNAIVPSKIDTDMLRGALGAGETEALLRRIPVGRFGTPEEIASLAVYLASEQAGYITGEAIVASGGYR